MLKSLKYLILSSTIAFTPTYQIDGMTRFDNTLSINEEMNTLLLSTNKSLPNNLKVSSIVATSVPDTVNYYKLYVEKTYDCKPYITYYTNSLGETSIFAKGTTKILYNQNQYEKKV